MQAISAGFAPNLWQVTTLQQMCPIYECIPTICLHSSIPNKFNMHYNLALLGSVVHFESEQVKMYQTFNMTPRFSARLSFVLPLLHSAISEPSKQFCYKHFFDSCFCQSTENETHHLQGWFSLFKRSLRTGWLFMSRQLLQNILKTFQSDVLCLGISFIFCKLTVLVKQAM